MSISFSGTLAASAAQEASGLLTAPPASGTVISTSLGFVSSIVTSAAAAAVTSGAAGGGGGGGGGKSSALAPEEESAMKAESRKFSHWLFLCLSAIAFIIIIYRGILLVSAHIRHLVCINDSTQTYWSIPAAPWLSKFKKDFILAPLFGLRHNEHFKIGSAGSAGIVPTRFQALFLLILFGGNIALTVGSIHWSKPSAVILSELRNRSGVLAVTNMVPLFVLAGRNNPLIPLLRISFDTYNLIHRWLGRIVVLEAIVHTVAHISNKGWDKYLVSVGKSQFIMTGTISTLAMIFLFIQSPSIIRHAFYETFLTLHILAAVAATVTLYYHLMLINNKWLVYVQVTIALWAAERFARLVSIIYRNCGRTMTRATITALSTEASRVTLDMPRPFKFRPGQYVFLYLPTVTGWQSHPFSVAWADESAPLVWDEKKEELPKNRQDVYGPQKTSVELIVRRRTGATNSIFQKAAAAPEGTVTVRALVEGPYGTHHSLCSYGTVVLFAGGVGITHQLPNVLELVQGYVDGTVATRKVTLIWVLQNPEHLQWVKRQMTSILAIERRREILKVVLFVTKPQQSREIMSPSSTVQMFPGKPNIEQVLQAEAEERVGTMAVSVCGPGAMSDDVRYAVRRLVDYVNIDFIEEAFSW
ncbi:hypothetical protein TWF225_002080 [Orbilia oligospora]|uniref:ferric-chelate reductase (NADPH) n=1 Tax=Orbilia oligospora TaxID=2813651 RepID=A0A7C8KGR9_ORBOL|nr:hypothetical protein TWF225_002080 [Orbilia oligospora]KAF3175901.1 hypothetical protein TWF751_003664 [Orbilia oligospora]KAF3247046.1 hypothetical protein TWF128_008791 [Orbilia oligospora]KAF3251896.1 hypothetical protein TWF217_007880 [Orbilia oligospora]KAF3290729.1 hypothetical protein TWF132_006800 [Orbilia oligospora]